MSIFKKIVRFIKSVVSRQDVEDAADIAIRFGADALVALLKDQLGPKVAGLIEDMWSVDMEGIVKKQSVVNVITIDVLDFLIGQAVPAGINAAKDLADSLVQSVYNDNPKTEVAKVVQSFVGKQAP